MNKYDISKQVAINAEQLLLMFYEGGTINSGSISIFGDSVGKPGDIIYSLDRIDYSDQEEMVFTFGSLQVSILKPHHIVFNDKVIGIQKCSRVIWLEDNLELVYESSKASITTAVVRGNHFFNPNSKELAFLFYTW